jgi:hypothetical protein
MPAFVAGIHVFTWTEKGVDGRNKSGHDAVRNLSIGQEVFLDVIAVGFEQHIRAAQLADLLFRPFDHAMALARLLVKHLASSRDLEALLGAGFGLDFGHLALLCGTPATSATAEWCSSS